MIRGTLPWYIQTLPARITTFLGNSFFLLAVSLEEHGTLLLYSQVQQLSASRYVVLNP